jgi:UDP-sulfoquinovose synthase
VFNQVTESHRVRDLAQMVSELTGAEVVQLPNPRREAAENELVVTNARFLGLGLDATTLSERLFDECTGIASKYRHRVMPSKIVARSVWREGMETAPDLVFDPNESLAALRSVDQRGELVGD